VGEVRVEPFATWLEALGGIAARAYAVVAAWCSYLIVAADTLLSNASAEERARRLLAAQTILYDFLCEASRATKPYGQLYRLREVYERESELAQRLEGEARAAAKFPKRAVELEELAAKARFRARCAFLFAEALERVLELEVEAELGLEPHPDWDKEGFKARLLMPLRAWRSGAASLLAAQAVSELRGGPARLHQLLATLAGDLAPFASFKRRGAGETGGELGWPFDELAERMERVERILEDLLKRVGRDLDPVSRALRGALLALDRLNPSTLAGRSAARRAARALEELRELHPLPNTERMLRELYTELARLNAKRVELGLKPKPLPPLPEEECGWCPECPFRSGCPEAKLIYGEGEEEEERRSYGGEEEW
jgi:hypothetical protein